VFLCVLSGYGSLRRDECALCGFVTIHGENIGENIPILGFMGDLSDYLVKNRKKNFTKLQKILESDWLIWYKYT